MSHSVEVSDIEFNGDGAIGFLRRVAITNPIGELPVTNLKILSAVAILTAAIATPVFARPTHHSRALDRYRGTYNQVTGPSYAAPRTGGRNLENFEFNRSFPGGEDPSNNPSGS
jgi:hypothetical protein